MTPTNQPKKTQGIQKQRVNPRLPISFEIEIQVGAMSVKAVTVEVSSYGATAQISQSDYTAINTARDEFIGIPLTVKTDKNELLCQINNAVENADGFFISVKLLYGKAWLSV